MLQNHHILLLGAKHLTRHLGQSGESHKPCPYGTYRLGAEINMNKALLQIALWKMRKGAMR